MQLIVWMSKFLKICPEKEGKQDICSGLPFLQWLKNDWKLHVKYNIQIKLKKKDITLNGQTDFER